MVDTIELTLPPSIGFWVLGRSIGPTLIFMMSPELRSVTSDTCGGTVELLMARGVVCTATTTFLTTSRNTINPKDEAASDINGYVRNVLSLCSRRG
jgi:hypothetical protein